MGPKPEYLAAARTILSANPEYEGRSQYDLAYELQAAAERWFKPKRDERGDIFDPEVEGL